MITYKFSYKAIIPVIILLMLTASGFAQTGKKHKANSLKEKGIDTTGEKDIIDVAKQVLRIKPSAKTKDDVMHTGKVHVAFLPFLEDNLKIDAFLSGSLNTSFYLGKHINTNPSVIDASFNYLFHREFVIPVVSNLWTRGNKYKLLGDWRYYDYPTVAYNLGSKSSRFVYDPIRYLYLRLSQEALRDFHSHYYAGMGYAFDHHYGIQAFDTTTNFEKYNKNATHTTSAGILFHALYDSRKNTINPKSGFYGSIILRTNFTFLGSSDDWQSVTLEFRKYISFKSHPKNIIAFWSWNVFTLGKAPYLDLPSTGWDIYSNTGRGYAPGRFTGKHMIYLEAEDRFSLTHNGLLGGVCFINAESVTEWPSNRFEAISPAAGIGLRIKFNKLSDTNLCIDYGVGLDGSNRITLNLGEVF